MALNPDGFKFASHQTGLEMEQLKQQKEWMTIPSLPCIDIETTLSFWEMLGFKITYKQTRPYQYGIVERGGFELHFGRVKGMNPESNIYNGCLVMVHDAGKVYTEFTQKFKESLGRVPNSGVPRISRMKPGATRFTLTDVSGNCIIFINYGEEDQETWEKADDKNQTPLQKAIAGAVRFRDYKEDEKAAAAILDVALRKMNNEAHADIAEALLVRIDLAVVMNDSIREKECLLLLNQLELADGEKRRLAQKHNVKINPGFDDNKKRVVVFKTNIKDISDVEKLRPLLDSHLKQANWNFDLEDCDKVLRIESHSEVKEITIKILRDNGYDCDELPL